jgi:4-azaleucine resistance transporter AzlC
MSTRSPTVRRAVADGVKAMAPLLLGIVPFGLILGVTAASTAIGGLLGFLTSPIIFGGAAQLAAVQLIEEGAAAVVVVATALVVNSRHLMYSAALAEPFRAFPASWRWGLPYLLTDQAFVLSSARWADEADPVYRRWYFLSVGLSLWVAWQAATAVGVIVGAEISESWSLDFAIPLVFLALLTASVKGRAGLAAAATAGVVAVAAAGMPWNVGLIVATVTGIVSGIAVRRWSR